MHKFSMHSGLVSLLAPLTAEFTILWATDKIAFRIMRTSLTKQTLLMALSAGS
ncbi:hypothetical protein V4B17_00625 [Bartonella sp. B23]